MKATEIQALLNATVLVGPLPEDDILTACGSDMMSDVLAFPKDRMVLLTGLTNPHTVRTAELLDVMMIVFVRGKLPNEEGLAHLGRTYEEVGATVQQVVHDGFPRWIHRVVQLGH